MPGPFLPGEKLRVQFRKSLRKSYVRNAQLYPEVPAAVRRGPQAGHFIVGVDRTDRGRFCLAIGGCCSRMGTFVKSCHTIVREASIACSGTFGR